MPYCGWLHRREPPPTLDNASNHGKFEHIWWPQNMNAGLVIKLASCKGKSEKDLPAQTSKTNSATVSKRLLTLQKRKGSSTITG